LCFRGLKMSDLPIKRTVIVEGEVLPEDNNGGMEMFNAEGNDDERRNGHWNPSPGGSAGKKEWTWSSIMREVAEMYPEDLIQLVGENSIWAEKLRDKPPRIQMKYIVAAVAMAALSEAPIPALLNSVIERTEGKMPTVAKASDGSLMQIVRKRVAVDTEDL